jgi:DivIVA domain-containing protein
MSVDPDAVTRKSFDTSFRGYDPMEVQAYLLVLADELRAGRDREFELELRLSEADRRAREAQAEAARLSNQLPPPGPPSLDDLDDGELARLLGDETARVLEAARTGAADITARAVAEAEATIAEAGTRARARL